MSNKKIDIYKFFTNINKMFRLLPENDNITQTISINNGNVDNVVSFQLVTEYEKGLFKPINISEGLLKIQIENYEFIASRKLNFNQVFNVKVDLEQGTYKYKMLRGSVEIGNGLVVVTQ